MTAPHLSPTGLAGILARRGIHYGWVVVAATFLTMLVTAGAVGTPGVLIGPLQKEFGWSAADISVSFAVRLALFGLMGPFAAALINHFGTRRVIVLALLLVATGVCGSFFMTKLWQLVLFWGVFVGMGTGMTAMVLGATVAGRWFVERRGLVTGLLAASGASGQLVFLPLLADLTERLGWRTAFGFAVAALALATVVVVALMRDRPSDVGLAPYGSRAGIAPAPARGSLRAMLASPITALREASGSATFWMLFGSFFVCGASTNGLVQTHFVPLCGDFGLGSVQAAGVLAGIGVFDLFGTIASGWLSDRFDSRRLLFVYYGLRGLSLVLLPFSNFDFYQLSLFAIFYGLDWIATVPPTVKLTAERFGERSNLVFGWVFTAHQLGAATAAFGAGFTRTEFDTYLPAFFVSGVLCLVAAVGVVAVRERRHLAGAE